MNSPLTTPDSATPPARLLRLSCLFAGLAVLALSVDVVVYRFCSAGHVAGDVRRLLTWSELFAHGLGVVLLVLTMFVLDPPRRNWIPRILVMSLGAGLVADLAKPVVARFRPNHLPLPNQSVWDSFAGWVPAIWPVAGFSRFDHRLQSFPSAHTAVATGLAIGLSSVYPRGRHLFALFAVLAALQRIESGAHFVSDTLGGAAIGCLVAAAVLSVWPVVGEPGDLLY